MRDESPDDANWSATSLAEVSGFGAIAMAPVHPVKGSLIMTKFFALSKKLFRSEEGASMVEYGLLVGLIAIVVAVGATTLGGGIKGLFTSANGSL